MTAYSYEKVDGTPFLDCAGAGLVEVEISVDGRVLWVHVDGCTILRAQRAERIEVQEDTLDRLVSAWHATARQLRRGT